ncbi:unnamed protein product, partial [Mesorhabditis belari]|uniref:C-type lectin domain-containing protein n=1 Tax=Mesorhabditis belari TaxID=2138241 RepID=A0AAF3FSP1_9BILA
MLFRISNVRHFTEVMSNQIGDSSPYIGVEQTQNFTWVYADGSTLKYQNWAPGEPVMLTGWSCAIIDGQTGKWKGADCNSSRTSVCSIDYVHTCPTGWTYFAKTGLCY